ncbi:MAG: hypothetical protein J1F60_10760 [Oscillospiraceae bacterium]|nr:hypothetical protein [Oscillospiraceae bacterium]
MGTVQIRYFNVIFYLRIRTERELFMFQALGDRIEQGEALLMKDIVGWCRGHNIEYTHKFFYRKDFVLSANLWNFYSYMRFQIEQLFKK